MITLASAGMERQLDRLWRNCFYDPVKVTRYFFKYRFVPDNTPVAVEEKEVVSALYLLPCKIRMNGRLCKAQYVYAAATLPQFRNRGLMTELLRKADELGRENGVSYTVLVPSSQSLFRYYEKSGYQTYFYLRKVQINRQEMLEIAQGGKQDAAAISDRLLWTVRNEALGGGVGNVNWDKHAVGFAVDFYCVCGGEVFSAARDGSVGYTFFREHENFCEVTEIVSDENTLPGLAYQMISSCKCDQFVLRLPVGSPLFPGRGEVLPFGMIKTVPGQTDGIEQAGNLPYLGLHLD